MVLFEEGEGCVVGGLGGGVVLGLVQLVALRVGLTMEGGRVLKLTVEKLGNQPINQSINQSINRSINQSIN